MPRTHILRHSNKDTLLIALSFLHAAALLLMPSILLVAVGVWWNSNTVSHNFLHLPFFRSRAANRAYALYLSALLGIPQSFWRERHLAHHSARPQRVRLTFEIALETVLILVVWSLLLFLSPHFFRTVYLPGCALGLGLCYVHGYFEHAGKTTSHYGVIYNFSFFNDGYHVEHHTRPGEHWSRLSQFVQCDARVSRWPAVLRWIETINLERLERLALRSKWLQLFLLRTHERALRRLLPKLPSPSSVTIVGGGMYPRTALLLRRLLPDAAIRIVDANAEHLDTAKAFLSGGVALEHRHYEPGQQDDADLLVIPLCFDGDREAVYRNPAARAVLVHDWVWARRGHSAIVSCLLLKRLNLIVR